MTHPRINIRIVGNVLAHICILLYGIDLPKGSYDIVVEEGCVSLTKMEEDREKLLALAQIVPDEFKPLISQKIVKTLDLEGGEELSEQLYNMLPAELRGGVPSWQEFQAMQIQMQQLQQQLAESQEQNKTLNDQLTQAQLRTQSDLVMEDKKFEHEVAMKLLDNAETEKLNAQKVLLDAKREEKAEENKLMEASINAKEKLAEKALGVMEKAVTPPPQPQNMPNLS